MASLVKKAKRGLRRKSQEVLHAALHASPLSVAARFAPLLCYADMLFLDYGIARIPYNNRHRISDEAWRSAQPTPRHIRWLARRGVKTVINLRGGEQTYGTRWLEQRACAENGITFVDFELKSRRAPTRDELLAIKALLGDVQYPILVHCKSGADRAGLMSAMISHIRDGRPIRDAKEQLSWRFGHVRGSDTGVIDAVFDRYLADHAATGIAFWDWVETVYDPDQIDRTFTSGKWANRLVNGLLRRE